MSGYAMLIVCAPMILAFLTETQQHGGDTQGQSERPRGEQSDADASPR